MSKQAVLPSSRPPALRWLGWMTVLALLAILGAGMLAFLWPPEQRVHEKVVVGAVRVGLGWPHLSAVLARRPDGWAGAVRDFPSGSVTHFRPESSPGFFLVRSADETFRAWSDRSPHRGQPLEWRNPLPGTERHCDGPKPGFYDPMYGANHLADGTPFSGPAPRPIDPLPLTIEGDRLVIASHAACPPDLGYPPRWCRAR